MVFFSESDLEKLLYYTGLKTGNLDSVEFFTSNLIGWLTLKGSTKSKVSIFIHLFIKKIFKLSLFIGQPPRVVKFGKLNQKSKKNIFSINLRTER